MGPYSSNSRFSLRSVTSYDRRDTKSVLKGSPCGATSCIAMARFGEKARGKAAGHKERLEGFTLRCNATLGGGRRSGKGHVDTQQETRSVLQGLPWQHKRSEEQCSGGAGSDMAHALRSAAAWLGRVPQPHLNVFQALISTLECTYKPLKAGHSLLTSTLGSFAGSQLFTASSRD